MLPRLVTLLVCVVALSATAAPWKEEIRARVGKHPLPRPLTAEYDFGWSGLKAADATARFTRQRGAVQLELTARTAGMARTLWRMDTRGVSTVNAATLRPVKLTQTETYARKTIDTTVDFTPKGPRRLRVVNPPGKEQPKPKTFKFAQAHDLHSAFLFVRSQPLKKDDTFQLCVFPGSSPYLAEVTPGAPQKIKAGGKEWMAIPCSIKLREIEKDLTLAPHTKFKSATVWLSDDRDRLLLRIEADVFVGHIWAEMREVKFANEAPVKRG